MPYNVAAITKNCKKNITNLKKLSTSSNPPSIDRHIEMLLINFRPCSGKVLLRGVPYRSFLKRLEGVYRHRPILEELI
jgi:hypothetical protein